MNKPLAFCAALALLVASDPIAERLAYIERRLERLELAERPAAAPWTAKEAWSLCQAARALSEAKHRDLYGPGPGSGLDIAQRLGDVFTRASDAHAAMLGRRDRSAQLDLALAEYNALALELGAPRRAKSDPAPAEPDAPRRR